MISYWLEMDAWLLFHFHVRNIWANKLCVLSVCFVVTLFNRIFREENVRLHSKPGAVPKIPERKKHIVTVSKWSNIFWLSSLNPTITNSFTKWHQHQISSSLCVQLMTLQRIQCVHYNSYQDFVFSTLNLTK